MAYEYTLYEKKGHVATITLNRPQVLNSIHPPAAEELSAIWDDALADDNVWVIVLTGAGEKAFSAGNDLKYTAEKGVGSVTMPKGGFAGFTSRMDMWKPTIAAVNGFALGGGFEMALACDLIIAAEHARLGLPEPRVGLMAGAGGVFRLPRQMPVKVAMGYMLTGKHMTAQEALRWGIVNEVVPLKDLMPTVERWVSEILECAPLSVRASKQAAMMGLDMPLAQALSHPFPLPEKMWRSEDADEGPKAFAEKRKPNWKGK
jgi:enoyl-CoA hydratase/carnithine racemase